MTYNFSDVSILIVDESPPMLDIIKDVLKTFGVKTIIGADNSEKGLEELRRFTPDLVITDWMGGPVNGVELIEEIRKDPYNSNPYVPIIMMTGFSEQKRVISARDAGVTEFMVKPFNATDLYKRIEKIIEKPRPFVETEEFFGPDRRRKRGAEYGGPKRRDEDEFMSVDAGLGKKLAHVTINNQN